MACFIVLDERRVELGIPAASTAVKPQVRSAPQAFIYQAAEDVAAWTYGSSNILHRPHARLAQEAQGLVQLDLQCVSSALLALYT